MVVTQGNGVQEFKEFKEFRSSGVQEFRSSGVQAVEEDKIARRKRIPPFGMTVARRCRSGLLNSCNS
jgi:hypothetical protein